MRKTVLTVCILVMFTCVSCKVNNERNTPAENFILLKNGYKISFDEYVLLKRMVIEFGLLSHLQKELRKNNVYLTEKEIGDIVNSEGIRVVLETSEKNNSTTAQQGR